MITENGWPDCGPNQLDRKPIPGTTVLLPLQQGIPAAILKAFAADLNWYVESVYNSRGGTDEGGWTGTNSVPTSNHLGGTAFDYNWSDHPMGVALAGWNGSDIRPNQSQEPFVRDLLRYYTMEGLSLVFWANDWRTPKDSMHFQMGYGTFGDLRAQRFVDQFIDPATGFSRFKENHGLPGVDVVATLAQAMGGTQGVHYADFAASVAQCLRECECTTVRRVAMWCAQVGTESAGLKYMEEIASGAAYEGRRDLGNIQAGDGVRFKGRGPIQVTGRHNYTELSRWAFGKGLVPSVDFFVREPAQLSTPAYGFIGVTWYWTTQRPMNAASDVADVDLATKYVNGGYHGLADRKMRYNRAISMGERLLGLLQGEDDWMSNPEMVKMIGELHAAVFAPIASTSKYRDGDDDKFTNNVLWRNKDAMIHESKVERLAILGDPEAIALVQRESEKGDQESVSVLIRIDDRYLTPDQKHLKNTTIVARFPETGGTPSV